MAVAGRALKTTNDEIERVKTAGVVSSNTNNFPGQMTQIAGLINAAIPCQTYVVVLGGWDTHSGQPYNQWERLTMLNSGLAALFLALGGNASRTFAFVTSEFGRQVTQNAGQGTDHGRASTALVVGGGVFGGRYGAMPNLAPAARSFDAMVPTTDFRALFATILNRLGADANLTQSAMGSDETGVPFPDLGFFAPGKTQPPPNPTTTVAGGSTTTVPGGSTTVPSTTMPAPTTIHETSTVPATTVSATTVASTTKPTTTTPVPATTVSATIVSATIVSATIAPVTTVPATPMPATTTPATTGPRRRLSLGVG